ncbi:MAG: glycine--tRNA ligase subunit beta [Ponticaulis sp.]|nr:glycine--tRNA ligase subunit beta [Ponticaulis sp.]|tara:strand:- start:24499 stop:26787 length:2289 start_codon:yes stop_codon:yes gene_type:complete
MSQLLLEIFSEEIPARMQAKAEADLGSALIKAFDDAGLGYGGVETLSGPRRLAVIVSDVASKSKDVREERKGPKVGAPEKAVEGFMRGAGLTSIDQAEIRSDEKKGDFYVAVIETPGRSAEDIIADAVPAIIKGFHWPKSMRWGEGDLRWVRPLQRVTCVLGGKVVPFELEGLKSGNEVEGHRIHGRGPFEINDARDYRAALEDVGHVMLSRDERRDKIEMDAKKVCADAGLELVEDKGLLEEVTGLAEWPVVILGEMDPAFLDLPEEVIQLSMRVHQKYFAVRDPKTGGLAPNFVVVANLQAQDGGKKIAEGNSRVLSARLNDGRFFWDNDLATPLEEMGEKLSTIDFKKELGTIADKVERVAALARELAPKVGADPDLAERAARLSKSDLVSEMVYEFPELQGVMGRYYALKQGGIDIAPSREGGNLAPSNEIPASAGTSEILSGLSEGEVRQIADAIRDHYKPQGPSDAVPTEPVSIAIALADKLDTLVGFWAINELPTGSKDPFALRRAALGVVRLVLENQVRLNIMDLNDWAGQLYAPAFFHDEGQGLLWTSAMSFNRMEANTEDGAAFWTEVELKESFWKPKLELLLSFFADRLKQYLRDQGKRHDLIDAVFALGEDDLVAITKRVDALSDFLSSEDGANLLAGFKRAVNILKAEEKKHDTEYGGEVDETLLTDVAEKALYSALNKGENEANDALQQENFEAAMTAMSKLRAPIDAFFEDVIVNADDVAVRQNRLYLLSTIRSVLGRVADFTRIEG